MSPVPIRWTPGVLALLIVIAAIVGAREGTEMATDAPAPGDLAPEFSLEGSDGRTYRLADYRGREAVVLAWFPKAFTSGCTRECKSLRDSGEHLAEFDVAYFAISTDNVGTNRRFAESLALTYPILSDPTKDVARAYGVVGGLRLWPSRWTFYIGADGRILHIDKDVRTASAGADIMERLTSLGVTRNSTGK